MTLRYLFCYLLSISLCHLAKADSDSVTIRLSTHSKSQLLTAPPVLPVNLNPMELYSDSAEIKTVSIQKSDKEVLLKFSIDRPRTIMLMDFFGHQLYVRPGDFVDIELDTLADMTKPIVGDIPNVWSLKMQYKGPDRYYHAFFDSLAYVAGVLHIPSVSIAKYNNDLLKYFNACKKQYGQRMSYLFKYVQRYKLSKAFLRLAANEIKSTYMLALLQPFKTMDLAYANKSKLPPAYKEVLDGYNLQEMPDFFTTVNVSAAYIHWIQYYRTCLVLENTTSSDDLVSLMGMSAEYLKHSPEVSYAVSTHIMHRWLRRNLLPTQFAYFYFKNACIGGLPCSPVIDSMYQQLLAAGADTSSIKTLMVQSMKNDTLSLLELTGSQPVVIDLWASWCLPCRQQDVYLEKIVKKYFAKFFLVKLSMDRDQEAWLKTSEKYLIPPENGFLLPGNFESAFAKRFNISSIPRYILLDKDGKLINDNMPFPSKQEEFEKELKKAFH
jgi:thiol-disulfide isomerase/thioredoxin